MSDLRRFPVSDEFISYRETLDSVCDRMIFFRIFQFAFFSKMETFWGRYGNVGNDLAHRLEALSGARGASFRSKYSREVRNGHKCTFFQSFRKFEKWEVRKNYEECRANFSWAEGTGPGAICGLAVALCPENVRVPRENHACAG